MKKLKEKLIINEALKAKQSLTLLACSWKGKGSENRKEGFKL